MVDTPCSRRRDKYQKRARILRTTSDDFRCTGSREVTPEALQLWGAPLSDKFNETPKQKKTKTENLKLGLFHV
jgi:hypothetical protein